jgi:sensor histidine kinase YesM
VLDRRLDALRARLNPHFLFNALNSADVLARAGKAAETGRMLAGLTALLRYVLDERRATVPLGDELAFARQYLDVQEIRLGERLRYAVEVPPALERDAEVPQLLLQPIVENAVEHGIGRTLEGGLVRIAAARDGDWLRLTVEDEGPGPAASATDAPAGIGLASTRERLAHLFDGRATLTLEPRADRGTRVIICIPYQESRPPHVSDAR